MGKSLKGRELGTGISQQKDGLYLGRYTNRFGERKAKRFKTLKECKDWIAEETYNMEHGIYANENMTFEALYNEWLEYKKRTVKDSTYYSLKGLCDKHVVPVLSNMLIKDIRALHCQKVLNAMADNMYCSSSLEVIKAKMSDMFNYAIDNELLTNNPCNRTVKYNIGKVNKPKEALTISQQREFIELTKNSHYSLMFRFALQTGLRSGELAGLRWSDIDFNNKCLTVSRTIQNVKKEMVIHNPKTDAGKRTIPLTNEAIDILKLQKKQKHNVVDIQWSDNVFLNRDGKPFLATACNAIIHIACSDKFYCSMHILRHTFATRCIEAGMKPKTLQKIMGHTDISTTMNMYVHTTEDEKIKEMELVAKALKVI